MAEQYVYGWYHYSDEDDEHDVEFRFPAKNEHELKINGNHVLVEVRGVHTTWAWRRGVVVWGGGNYTVIPA